MRLSPPPKKGGVGPTGKGLRVCPGLAHHCTRAATESSRAVPLTGYGLPYRKPPRSLHIAPEKRLGYAPRILVVDDEPSSQLYLEQLLSAVGYSVTVVGTAREALAHVRSREFDVALVDVSRPDEDGLEVVRQMRSASRDLKILATSGYMLGEVRRQALAAGATDTLPKPTPPETLLQTVYRLIEPHGSWVEDDHAPAQ